jgi:hypothetical protein
VAKYHVIFEQGVVRTADWLLPLQFGCPRFEHIRDSLGFKPDAPLEHVSVLWQGKLAHMFVDEIGLMTGRELNPKATRVYWNNTLSRHGRKSLLYNDLTADPAVNQIVDTAILEGLGLFEAVIVGPALLWEGDME